MSPDELEQKEEETTAAMTNVLSEQTQNSFSRTTILGLENRNYVTLLKVALLLERPAARKTNHSRSLSLKNKNITHHQCVCKLLVL